MTAKVASMDAYIAAAAPAVRPHLQAIRAEARADIFDYIELFYNRLRQHRTLGNLSPMEFERVESVQ